MGINQRVQRVVLVLQWLSAIVGVAGILGVGYLSWKLENDDELDYELADHVVVWLDYAPAVVIASALFWIGAWVIDLLGEVAFRARGDADEE